MGAMAKKRKRRRVDALIDAHAWLRRMGRPGCRDPGPFGHCVTHPASTGVEGRRTRGPLSQPEPARGNEQGGGMPAAACRGGDVALVEQFGRFA